MRQFRPILTPLLALAALLEATVPAVASSDDGKAAAYPGSEVLAAFRAACTEFDDFDKAHGNAIAQGWADIAVDETTPGGRLVLFGEGMIKNNPAITMIKGPLLRRDVMGRDLFLAISGARVDGNASKGCRMYDFAAPAPLSRKVLVAFMGREAETDRTPIDGFTIASWTPGMADSHMEFEAAHVAQGTTLPASMPISGIMLKAQIVEIDKR